MDMNRHASNLTPARSPRSRNPSNKPKHGNERRLGELIREQKETVGLNQGAKGSIVTGATREPVKDTRPTLGQVGIDKKLSSRSQAIGRF